MEHLLCMVITHQQNFAGIPPQALTMSALAPTASALGQPATSGSWVWARNGYQSFGKLLLKETGRLALR